MTPDKIIRRGHAELDDKLSLDLLARVIAAPPKFFERLVVQLLLAMGCGGSTSDAGRASVRACYEL
jgi:restriction system protein